MKEESQEIIRWDGSEWERMLQEVFKTVTTSLPPDITLVTEDGKMLETHSLILKASSPFFRVVLGKWRTSANNNPTIIYMPGFSHEQLVLVVEFIYQGRTTVADNLLHVFVATANSLGMLLKPTAVPVPGTFEKTAKEMVDDVDATEGQEIS